MNINSRKIIVNIVMIFLLYLGIQFWQTKDLAPTTTLLSTDLALPVLDGKTAPQLLGKKTLVYVFAPWCGVCDLTSTTVESIFQNYKDQYSVTGLALSYESIGSVRNFANRHGLSMPILIGNDQISQKVGIKAFPTFLILDEQGQIEDHAVGYTTKWSLMLRIWI